MVEYTWGPAIPPNCAHALVSPIPMPVATLPSNARILSGQMTGYAEPAHETATIKARYRTTGLLTVTRMM